MFATSSLRGATPNQPALFEFDRIIGLGLRSPAAGERVDQLCDLALRGLQQMYVGAGMFVQTMRGIETEGGGRVLRAEGDNLRYAAIAALGLSRVDEGSQRRVLKGHTASDLAIMVADRATEASDLGAIALAAWAAAEVAEVYASELFELLTGLLATGRPVETVSCAWALTAALAGQRHGDTAQLAALSAGRLADGQAATGLFPHVLPAEARGRLRAHVGCFADQVYPIQALARLAVATDNTRALEAANACAGVICDLQGTAGQWWWHYDTRTGGLVEGYPVYSVHQHAMAPMALLDLWEAGGESQWRPVIEGLAWIYDHPESSTPLIAEADAVVWRKIGRREPAKAVRSISAVTTSLRSGWYLPGLDAAFPPGRVDYECRPYELGWLLYAWRSAGVVQALRQPEAVSRHG